MESLELSILLPAFIAGVLVLATHVPLGMSVLARGIIFADLAVAQIAGLGVILAELLGIAENGLMVQIIALSSALIGASLLAYLERRLLDVQEAAIGLLFVLAATAGILLMSRDVHAGEHLQDLLIGQILWVTQNQLILTALVTAALLSIWYKLNARLNTLGFYALFSLAITVSVQLVGVYLVFASLIVPALVTHRFRNKRLLNAFGIGIGGYGSGLLLSVWFDLPAGAAIVWAMTFVGLIWLLIQRQLDRP